MEKQHFITVIQANKGAIMSLCKAYYKSPEDQKDAFQDIILQLWKSFHTFRGKSGINTWIYRVGINTILTNIRKDKKRIPIEPLETHSALATAKADDEVELLSIVIASLKDLDKAIVMLYLEGYKNKEIAEILEMSTSNISTRLNRVKSQLKEKFKKPTHVTR